MINWSHIAIRNQGCLALMVNDSLIAGVGFGMLRGAGGPLLDFLDLEIYQDSTIYLSAKTWETPIVMDPLKMQVYSNTLYSFFLNLFGSVGVAYVSRVRDYHFSFQFADFRNIQESTPPSIQNVRFFFYGHQFHPQHGSHEMDGQSEKNNGLNVNPLAPARSKRSFAFSGKTRNVIEHACIPASFFPVFDTFVEKGVQGPAQGPFKYTKMDPKGAQTQLPSPTKYENMQNRPPRHAKWIHPPKSKKSTQDLQECK